MRRRVAIAAAALAAAGAAVPASAPAARVELMVVGEDRVRRDAGTVRAEAATVRVGRRRCRVARDTPLAALAATRLPLTLRDYGRCNRRPRNAGGIYVRAVAGERERGLGGWVYKVGRRIGTTGAADPSGPFGTGRRLRPGARLLWFWCKRAGRCQRTLEVRPERRTVAPGEDLRVTVRGYDDQGSGRRVARATVRLGAVTARTGGDGTAVLRVPAARGALRLRAERDGMVPAFPERVRVG